MTSVGIVALDGTKMAANAALSANRTKATIDDTVAEMFAEAKVEFPRQTGHRTMLQLRARMTPRTSPGRDTQGNCGVARYYTT